MSCSTEITSGNLPSGPVIVTVCTSCRAAGVERDNAPGRQLFDCLKAAETGDVVIRPTQCLSVCKRVCTVSLSAEGGYTYVVGDLDPTRDAADILTMAGKIGTAPHGFVPWQDRPEAVKRAVLARVPPPGWSPDDGSAPA